MSCTPFIYTTNTNVATVASGGTIPLGSVTHQMCDHCVLNGDGIICKCRGAFRVSLSLTFVVPSADSTTTVDTIINILQDNVAIPGATATVTADSATGYYSINIDTIVRNDTRISSVLTVQNASDAAISVSNCGLIVEPL